MAASNTSLFDDILDSLLFTPIRLLARTAGGWLLLQCTYNGVSLSFMCGLYMPVLRSKVTSKKLTTFAFAYGRRPLI